MNVIFCDWIGNTLLIFLLNLSANRNTLTHAAYDHRNMLVPMVQVALLLMFAVMAAFARVADIKTSIAVQQHSLRR